jgi:beta-phosphoglucomutase-like phosphatase (HAD superfamily)
VDRRPVIFDCDGVLVDSEALSWEAWSSAIEVRGGTVTDADVRELTGRTAQAVAEALIARSGLSVDVDGLLEHVHVETAALFRGRLEAFEDAEDTVDHLYRIGFPLAIASSSTRARLDLSLSLTEVDQCFSVSVAGDEVVAGKPAPDIYLAAAEQLNVDPTTCTAVEDSPSGIASARAAGMFVVAIDRGHFEAADIATANLVVPSLTPAVFFG